MIVHNRPDEAVREAGRTLRKLRQESGEVAYKEELRRLLREDLWFLIRAALGWWYLDEELHGKTLMRFCLENKERDNARVLPRGHVKTQWACAEIIQELLRDQDKAILAVSATDKLAKAMGLVVGGELLTNELLQYAFDDILPKRSTDCDKWGQFAYTLPNRKPRKEPSLMLASIKTNVTGFHPDEIYIDDATVRENNTPEGWAEVESAIDNYLRLLPSYGLFRWNATRWNDGDPIGKAISGELEGKQGKFQCLVLSCFVGDDPKADAIYPHKKRWNSEKYSGFPKEQLLREMNSKDTKRRAFFSCQMRNDPVPIEEARVDVNRVQIYKPEDAPDFGHCRLVGVDTIGGGLLIYNLLEEECEKLNFQLPLEKIKQKRESGVTKADRITAVLEPIIREGRFFATQEMIGDASDVDNLGYELRRLGAARHDDIADAAHIIPAYLSTGIVPTDKEPAHLYIAVDAAYSEDSASDFTVLLAGCVDSKNQYWILGYDRFRLKSPSALVTRIIAFFMEWNTKAKGMMPGFGSSSGKRHSFARTYL